MNTARQNLEQARALIQDEMRDIEQRVPVLGSIPLIGALFRASQTQLVKTNLMIFIKPTILRDSVATAYETNEKYQLIRNMQLAERDETRKLLMDFEPPTLPERDMEGLQKESMPTIDLRALPEAAEPTEESLNVEDN